MLASYVDVIEEILTSSENMQLDEHLLIGGWIDRYFLECPKHKIKTLITVLVRVFDKSTLLTTPRNEGGSSRLMKQHFFKYPYNGTSYDKNTPNHFFR